MVIVKIIWIVISLLLLPKTGENYQEENRVKRLYYRVRLTNESNTIAPITPVKSPSRPKVSSMSGYKLLGLYNSKKTLVVTVEKARKTTILSKGEKINGFELIAAGANYALFKKSGKEFKLSLNKIKNTMPSTHTRRTQNTISLKHPNSDAIAEQNGVKVISRNLLTSYTKNIDKIWKDISIAQNQKNGKLNGFKINYVKKGSDFEKLGLKRGDILMGINAQPLNSLSAAMNFFKEINDIENLTLTVERNGKSEDIEYEIQ
jgi:general secretion pathway protein C